MILSHNVYRKANFSVFHISDVIRLISKIRNFILNYTVFAKKGNSHVSHDTVYYEYTVVNENGGYVNKLKVIFKVY